MKGSDILNVSDLLIPQSYEGNGKIGNLQSYKELHVLLYPKLFSETLLVVNDSNKVDSLIQEVFVELWANHDSGELSLTEHHFSRAIAEKIQEVEINFSAQNSSLI